MKFFSKSKDGGPDSTVTGYFLIEIKNLFSIVFLKFENGSRDAYHTHAFNCISWLISGTLLETVIKGDISKDLGSIKIHTPSIFPILTYKHTYHKVNSIGNSYVLSFRGPWSKTWREYLPQEDKELLLADGRKIISEQ